MILGFGGLVLLSVGYVLYMSVTTSFSNTFSLLNSRAVSLVDGMERSIRSETDQAERTIIALSKLSTEGSLKVGQLDEVGDQNRQSVLKALMISSPVVEALLIYDLQGRRSGVFRSPEGIFTTIPFAPGDAGEFTSLKSLTTTDKTPRPVWGNPVVLNKVLFHNVGIALKKNGVISGIAVAAIGQNNMNRIVSNLGRDNDTTAFVLTSGYKVIAHSGMPNIFKDRYVIDLSKFPDPALQQIEDAQTIDRFEITKEQNMRVRESGDGLSGGGYVFITRELEGYSAKPYQLGAYFPKTEIGSEIRRAIWTAIAGLGALLLAVMASYFLSRQLSKPMQRIAKIANDFSNLKLDNYKPFPPSRIREIDEQGRAMNAMHVALSEFSHYVPRSLVKRLMKSGVTKSVERKVTIMFTDIVGFTTMSEDLNAVETATLLNNHFDLIGREISKHNGTVDKFIGDGLMAFWGAPEDDDDQEIHALNAAQDIVAAMAQLNNQRQIKSKMPIRLRIGIHTGTVVVGNIGSRERHNFTIVGDAVNVTHRLEQFSKEYLKDAPAIIVASKTTWQAAGKPTFMHSMGTHKLRGREKLIEIFTASN